MPPAILSETAYHRTHRESVVRVVSRSWEISMPSHQSYKALSRVLDSAKASVLPPKAVRLAVLAYEDNDLTHEETSEWNRLMTNGLCRPRFEVSDDHITTE